MKFQMPDVKDTLEGISALMENDIEKKVEVSSCTSCVCVLFIILFNSASQEN